MEVASLTIDALREPVITLHAQRTPPYSPQPVLHVLRGWPPAQDVELPNPGARFPLVQPAGDGWWVVDARTKPSRPNGWLLSADGAVLRDVYLGDGIEDLQVDAKGNLWISRFDEGIFGDDEPRYRSGLTRFAADGEIQWTIPDAAFMADCYAMNVVAPGEVWTCSYERFPLLEILDDRPIEVMAEAPVRGSDGLAVSGTLVMFAPGYDEGPLTLVNHRTGEVVGRYAPRRADGSPIGKFHALGRGNRLYLLADCGLMGVELRDAEPYVVGLRAGSEG